MTEPSGAMTGGLVLRGGRVWHHDGWREHDLVIAAGRVVDGTRSDATALNATGLLVAPGFIDLQINGGYGNDITGDPHSLWHLASQLPEQGVTAFLPTVITAPPGTIDGAIQVFASGPPGGWRGAAPLGLHLEGPMISRRGTHPERWLRPASPGLVAGWSRPAGIALVTLAPELPGALEVVEQLSVRGVVVSAGHSNATALEARAGFAAGITVGTHLYNAMSGLDHRRPGLAAALLGEPGVRAGIICDGVHCDPEMVRVAWSAKRRERLFLVTDAIAALGLGEGSHRLGEVEVEVHSGEVRNPEGALAGSVLAMDQAVRNLVSFTGCDPADAIHAASTTPAALLGESDRGHLDPGARGDVVLLDDDLEVVATIIGGEMAHRSQGVGR